MQAIEIKERKLVRRSVRGQRLPRGMALVFSTQGAPPESSRCLQTCPTIQAKDILKIGRETMLSQNPTMVRRLLYRSAAHLAILTSRLDVPEEVPAPKQSKTGKTSKHTGKKAAGAHSTRPAGSKKRKRDSDGPQYVRGGSNILGEIAEKDEAELELEKALFGDTGVVERFGGEIQKKSSAPVETLEDKLHKFEGVATSTVRRCQLFLLSLTREQVVQPFRKNFAALFCFFCPICVCA